MTKADDRAETPPPGRARILVVDDEPHFARSLVRLLQDEGYTVASAGTVAGALELLGAQPFDVLLCDWHLPDGNGCNLMQAALRGRPIAGIAMTGSAGEEDEAESQAAGFAEHLRKPVMIEDVLAAIGRAVQRPENRTGAPA